MLTLLLASSWGRVNCTTLIFLPFVLLVFAPLANLDFYFIFSSNRIVNSLTPSSRYHLQGWMFVVLLKIFNLDS